MKRREFITNSAMLLAASAILSGCHGNSSLIIEENKIPRRKFKDITLPLLSLGCLRLPKIKAEINLEELQSMVDFCLAHGINYFDTGYFYCNKKSESALGKVLKKYNRKDYYIATKFNPIMLQSRDDFKQRFEKIELGRLNTDYIDFYLIHNIKEQNSLDCLEKYKMYEDLVKLKEEGKIKYIGASFHCKEDIIEKTLKKYDFDFCYLKENYFEYLSSESVKIKNDIIKKHNIPIIAMEPLYGGRLARLEKEAQEFLKQDYPDISAVELAFSWCINQNNIVSILSGMSNTKQIEENFKYFQNISNFKDDKQVCKKIVEILNKYDIVNCIGCRYCHDVCEHNVDIANIFQAYNEYVRDKNKQNLDKLTAILDRNKKTSSCTNCNECFRVCPQTLQIPKIIQKIYDEVSQNV